MGTWGYGPLENDQAADWLSESGILDNIERDLFVSEEEEVEWQSIRRAAAYFVQVLWDGGFRVDLCRLSHLAMYRLSEVYTNEDWINQFEEPEELRNSILEQFHKMQEIFEECKRMEEDLSKIEAIGIEEPEIGEHSLASLLRKMEEEDEED
jgi:hypothetical protein